MAKIDVLIPVFNGARTIESSVRSILNQSEKDIIVHIVNDGSTDDTALILDSLASEDARICIHTKINGGIVDALNFGLAFCGARYLARHDADDIAYTNRFEVQMSYLDCHADCVAVGAAVKHIDALGNPTGSSSSLPSPSNSNPFAYPSREPYIIHPFLMVRREAIQAVGGYRYALHCEDSDLYWRIQHIGTLHNLPDYLGEYRLHDGSISGSSLLNGRLMAIFSQIAAISEQRRRADTPDVILDRTLIDSAKICGSLQELVDLCTSRLKLDENEHRYLSLSASAKLLELTSYRPYDIDLSDSIFISEALRKYNYVLDTVSSRLITRQISGVAASLAVRQKFPVALPLLSWPYYGAFVYRLGLRLMLPTSIRLKIRSLLRGSGPGK